MASAALYEKPDAGILVCWMEAILENLTEAVTVADKKGRIILRNRTAREMTLSDDLEGSVLEQCPVTLRYLDGSLVPKEDYPLPRILRGEPVQRAEFVLVRRDGTTRIAQFSGTVISQNQTNDFIVVTCIDVTDMRRYREAQQDYVRAVSHDLRNPLAALLAQAQVLELESKRKGMFDETRAAQVILSNGRRINAMLDDFIESLRLDAGLGRLRPGRTDLRALVSDVADRYRTVSGGDRLRVVLPDEPCWAVIDSDRIQRCVENLLGNAFQYSPSGTPVTLSLEVRNGSADIIVTDCGQGIAPEHLPRIFDRFYRADSTYGRGLGLGLYIVKMTADAHGGTISVESAEGKGSTFTLSLPLS